MEMVPQLHLPLKEFGQVRKQFHFPLRNSDSARKSRIMDDTRLIKGNYYGGKLPTVSAIWARLNMGSCVVERSVTFQDRNQEENV